MSSSSIRERQVEGVFQGGELHWVGDGFRVSNYFPSADSGQRIGNKLSPFFLMDYHPPYDYSPSEKPRGVGAHPHRGFETVSIAWKGSVAHHDSLGHADVIGPGDVQWMTAASGILHKEYHEKEFSKRGGTMHFMQLWVNLPKAHKMAPPRYQPILASQIANVELEGGAGLVRIIAGEFRGVRGPAKTFSPVNLWEISLKEERTVDLSFPAKENVGLLVISGELSINGGTHTRGTIARSNDLVVFANAGEAIHLEATKEARVLLLGGEPIDEPVVQYGPFVMNTEREIRQAIVDFNSGKFGELD